MIHEKDFKIPPEWVISTFDEINSYRSQNLNPMDYPDEVFELYSVPNFPSDLPEISSGSEIGSIKQNVQAKDVLVCKINPRINRVWQVYQKSSYRQIASSEWIVFRSPLVNADFYQYYFKSSEFRNLICADVTGVGGSLTRAQPSKVANFSIPLPPLPEQIRITNKLDTLMAHVSSGLQRLERMQALLKQFRQSVVDAAVSGELTREWRGGIDAEWPEENLGNYVNEITQGWSPVCEKETASLDEWGIIKTTAIQAMKFHDNENKKLPISENPIEHLEIKSGDLLITRKGPRVRAGVSCYVRQTRRKLMVCDTVYRLRINKYLMGEFAEISLNSSKIMEIIDKQKAGISESGLNIKQESLLNIRIKIPSIDEQQAIIFRVEKLFFLADNLEKRYTQAMEAFTTLTPALLAKAFRGELVPQDPSDEPG